MDLGKMTDEQLIELLREGKTEITDYPVSYTHLIIWRDSSVG